MEKILSKYGFVKDDNTNSWIRDNWVVNFGSELIEFAEDFDKVKNPRYFIGLIDKIDVETILEDIS